MTVRACPPTKREINGQSFMSGGSLEEGGPREHRYARRNRRLK
jgi:hypothetical protein